MPFQIQAHLKGLKNKVLNSSANNLVQAKEEAKAYFQGRWKLRFENLETGELETDPEFKD